MNPDFENRPPAVPPAHPGRGDEPPSPTSESLRVPAPGSFTPRVRPASITGESAPAGASFSTLTPSPLPDRGASLFFFINLVAAFLAVTFTVLIALKL